MPIRWNRICFLGGVAMAAMLAESGDAGAAGYGLTESTSASAAGTAGAGASAGTGDISSMFANPATMTRHKGTQVMGGALGVFPEARFEGGSATTVFSTPIAGDQAGEDVGKNAVVPSLYAMWQTSSASRLGLAVTVPWGLSTEHPDTWIGRYHALKSALTSFNINPMAAYRLSPALSVGGGVQFQHTRGSLSNAIDFGSIGSALSVGEAVPAAQDGHVEMNADDWGVGFNLGALWEPRADTRIGLAFRSAIKHRLDGKANFTLDSAGTGAALVAGTGAFTNAGANAELTTPERLSAGVVHEIDHRWSVMGEVAWTAWSRFQELRITSDNAAQADDVTVQDWNDTVFVSLGAAYRADRNWTLRGGLAYDQSPVPDSTRNPRIPDEDRYWVSVGAGYRTPGGIRVDLSYTHFFMQDGSIDLNTSQDGNTFRGNLNGSFSVTSNLLILQALFPF